MSDTSEDLEAAVAELLLVTAQLTRRLRTVSNQRELTWSQMAVVAQLDKQGPTTTAELARLESVKPQSMGVNLAALEAEGLVHRQPHPIDGRQVLFALTEDGLAVRRQARLARHDWMRQALGRLTADERKTLTAAIALFRRIGEQ